MCVWKRYSDGMILWYCRFMCMGGWRFCPTTSVCHVLFARMSLHGPHVALRYCDYTRTCTDQRTGLPRRCTLLNYLSFACLSAVLCICMYVLRLCLCMCTQAGRVMCRRQAPAFKNLQGAAERGAVPGA